MMSTYTLRNKPDPIDLLERMLNKSTLKTQKASHHNVIEIGGKVYRTVKVNSQRDKDESVRLAVEEAREEARRELRAALRRQKKEDAEDKRQALQQQKDYFENLARMVAEQRDKLEQERMAELTRKLVKEKEEALQRQWEECERTREDSVREAIENTTKRLRREFNIEKQRDIEKALAHARELFKKHLEETVRKTIEDCERQAEEEAGRVAKLFKEERSRLNDIIYDLRRQLKDESDARQMVQGEFKALQMDYKRFINYTDGKYHSDYMMKLRKHGMNHDSNWDRRESQSSEHLHPHTTYIKVTQVPLFK